jgi:predicted dehydrogenase
MGFDAERSYRDVAEMLERERQRNDGIDAVAIMTPNDTHFAFAASVMDGGLDVVCDKPVTHDFREACDLVARTRRNARIFAIAHGYSAYPMTRYARALVRDGALGSLRLVQVEYIQSGMATRVEDGPQNNRLRWILDPQRSGQALVMSAIGCHAQHLASFTSGCNVARVSADVGSLIPDREVVDYVSALIEFDGGARGTFTVTQAAAGGENDIRLRIYGEKGSTGRIATTAISSSRRRVNRHGSSGAAIRSCRRRSSRWGARPADIPKVCARRSRISTRKWRRSGWRARLAKPFPISRIRESRRAHTRWHSSRRASRRRNAVLGSTSRRFPRPESVAKSWGCGGIRRAWPPDAPAEPRLTPI